jgi:Uma2 family endonuclease
MQLVKTKSILLDVGNITLHVTHQEFEQLCRDNPELRLELTEAGELITMPPAGWESSRRNSSLVTDVAIWNRQTKLGEVFDSSGGFTLPNGAVRSPDVSWLEKSKCDALSPDVAFPEVVPDFVIELRSKTDNLTTLQAKMHEYQTNGVRLGWLINPQQQQVEIYRLGKEVEVLQSPTTLSGEDILPGFALDLSDIFNI